MDFKDQIKIISERTLKLKEQILTEEATKNAFIMPFIQSLGYDIFNPIEVVPEFVADIGLKKGEKIDYAIFNEGKPAILIECKHWSKNLDLHDGQLLRYFHVSKAKFGMLTNGIEYRFYSDLVEPNKMDEKPFLEFIISDIKDNQLEELKKFHKTVFDVASIVSTASELKYTKELKLLIHQELTNPSSDFVRHLAKRVYPGVVTAKILEQFTSFTKRSVKEYISDLITDRFQTVLSQEEEIIRNEEKVAQLDRQAKETKIVTTQEEIESFMIIKSILRQKIAVNRISFKDTQSYLSILVDDNNRKLICRLYLNSQKKYLAFIDSEKKESKHEISSLDDIYLFSEQLTQTAELYM
jgi:hypothetical protein